MVVYLGLALVFLLHAETIARWMIREDRALPVLAIGPHPALWLGVGLIGTWNAANELGLVLNNVVDLFFHSGRLAADKRREALISGLKSVCFGAIGTALFVLATKRLGIHSAFRRPDPDAEPRGERAVAPPQTATPEFPRPAPAGGGVRRGGVAGDGGGAARAASGAAGATEAAPRANLRRGRLMTPDRC